MRLNNFHKYPEGLSQDTSNKPKLEDAYQWIYANIFRKCSHSGTDFKSALFISVYSNDSFTKCNKNRGVKTSEKENIIKVICPHMKKRSKLKE